MSYIVWGAYVYTQLWGVSVTQFGVLMCTYSVGFMESQVWRLILLFSGDVYCEVKLTYCSLSEHSILKYIYLYCVHMHIWVYV